jgi:phospholipase C
MRRTSRIALGTFLGLVFLPGSKPAFAQESLQKVKHIIIVMQENHSFDNYFGALAFAPDSPYHTPGGIDHDGHGACQEGDHSCVDGLSCMMDASGGLHCFNSNIDDGGHSVFTFHDSRRCVLPDLDHEWLGTHKEANFLHPNDALGDFRADGFVRRTI